MLFLKFFAVVANLSIFWCTLSANRAESDGFLLEDGKLTVNCFDEGSKKRLFQPNDYESVEELYLKGFVFEEGHVKEFSTVFCNLQGVTLIQCDINDELASLLEFPSDLKLIRLERLNLFFKGIHQFVCNLPSLLESFEVVDCLVTELHQQEQSTDFSSQEMLLDFSRFSCLKRICIENLSENVDLFNLLLSLTSLPLERIKLSRVYLTSKEWFMLLNEWKGTNRATFISTLKEFNFEIGTISRNRLIRLIFFEE